MKLMIALLSLVFAASAHAADPKRVLDCVVPVEGGTPVVTLAVDVQNESSADFLTITLNDRTPSTLFTQLEKGDVEAGLNAGQLGTLVLEEEFGMEDGVIRHSGLLMVSADQQNGGFSGFLSAMGNIYPLACVRK